MSIPPARPQTLHIFGPAPLIEPPEGQLSGDAGLISLGQFAERIGLTQVNASTFDDARDLAFNLFADRFPRIMTWPACREQPRNKEW
jgi:hypothetical protein